MSERNGEAVIGCALIIAGWFVLAFAAALAWRLAAGWTP